MKLLLHCSWPGQVEWWCETLQLHSEKLLCQFKGGIEADKRSFLPPLPPCPALWRKLWLRDFELEVLHLHVRENSEKISWGIFTLFLFFGSSFGYLLHTWILKAFLRAMRAAYIDYHVILIMFYYVILSEGYITLYYHYHVTLSCLFWLSCWICSAKINGQKSLTTVKCHKQRCYHLRETRVFKWMLPVVTTLPEVNDLLRLPDRFR